VATGEDLDDFIDHTKFTGVSWLPDGTGFFYSRYPLDKGGEADDSETVSVYLHRLGNGQSSDHQVFALDHPTRNPYATVTEDGRHLVVTIQDGFASNAVSWRPLAEETAAVEPLFDAWDGLYNLVGNDGDRLFFTANAGAPMGQVIAIDVRSREVEVVVPEAEHRLEGVNLVGGRLVALYLQDARSAVRIFDLQGQLVHDLELPGIGTASGFNGSHDDPETFFAFSGFTTPGQVFHYDVSTNGSELFREPEVDADLGRLVTRQVFYESQDGTRVPMFITHLKGIELDGRHPTLLFGYGGFDISQTPGFRVDRLVWMEQGGVFAVAGLRGGGEYGEEWHLAGTKENKQNVFDDFIAASEYLIREGYTSPEKLAIQGGSNGGLLVGAVLNQRPDLFGAALPAVGVMDMLRYHLPSANARAWSSDYGLAEHETDFEYLRAYSPLHNIAEGTCYPPTLVTTADHDDRVVPWHSFKYAAALQHAQGCDQPVLIRVETRAGHGAGKPTWMRIEEVADAWAFLADALGM
jgi:prolyl oligopeptidase